MDAFTTGSTGLTGPIGLRRGLWVADLAASGATGVSVRCTGGFMTCGPGGFLILALMLFAS